MRREGSMDDHPEYVPHHEYGLPVDLDGIAVIRSRLRRMRHAIAIGVYDDDLPPRPPPAVQGRDPGDESGFDPASAGSA